MEMEDTEARITPASGVSMLVLASTLFLGGLVLVIGCIVRRLSRQDKATDSTKNPAESKKVKFEDPRDAISGSTGVGATGGAGGGKRAKNKKRREAQQEFTHSWMVGALKGHTAPVLDMNFSSNGKFLASCAEDCGLRPEEEVLDPGESERYPGCKSTRETPPSTKTSTVKNKSSGGSGATAPTTASSTTSTKEDRAILSRRQRKNRTRVPRDQRRERDDEPEDEQPTQQQQQRHRRHCRQQHYQDSPTRSLEPPGIPAGGPRNGGSRRNQSQNDSHREEAKANASKANNNFRKSWFFLSHERKELLHLSDASLSSLLRRYILSGEQLAHLGYPMECSYFPGYAVIINHHHHPVGHRVNKGHHHLDANAREFVPGNGTNNWPVENEGDSGNCSGSSLENSDLEQESSSDSDKSSDIGESSSADSSSADSSSADSSSADSSSADSSSADSSSSSSYQEKPRRDSSSDRYEDTVAERRCARCFKSFYTNRKGGEYLHEERCVYHWGKLRSGLDGSHGDTWECCRGKETARGCTNARMHVWTGLAPGYNGPFEGYVHTTPARNTPKDGNYGVYAVDCEMCFTRRGLELAKVTVVGVDGKVVYDTMVRPDAEVIDYNTRFSGITAKDLARATKTLRDVQRDITSFIYAETILIGHGLENDLRALRLLHTMVIDTCIAFPHFLGYPFRSSLKTLARTVLRREIQVTEHDSVEDARIVVDLMLKKLQHDLS